MQKKEKNGEDTVFIGSLGKGMLVLEALTANQGPLGLTDIAEITGIGKSAAQRLLHTLTKLDYIRKDPQTRRYLLSPRVVNLAFGYLRSDPMVPLAIPHLLDVSERMNETVGFSRLIENDVMHLVRIPTRRSSYYATFIGRRVPAYCTAAGRAMLSRMEPEAVEAIIDSKPLLPLTPMTITDRDSILGLIERARMDGFSCSDQEVQMGELTVSAPVMDSQGFPQACIHAAVSTTRWTMDRMREELAPHIVEAARLVSHPPADA